jgi:hypothetical protein
MMSASLWRLPGRESLLGEQWNIVVVTHTQHMQTKWLEITSYKNLIQHKADLEQIGPLALLNYSIDDFTNGR